MIASLVQCRGVWPLWPPHGWSTITERFLTPLRCLPGPHVHRCLAAVTPALPCSRARRRPRNAFAVAAARRPLLYPQPVLSLQDLPDSKKSKMTSSSDGEPLIAALLQPPLA
jgi:hypothetical protein